MSDSDLLDAAIRACGDPARWDRLSTLRLQLRLRGNILATRGKSPFLRPYTVEISTREPRAVVTPFGPPGGRGIFAGDAVRIESPGGQLIAERAGARAHARDHQIWDDLDLLYFV